MTVLRGLLDHPLAARLGWTLLHFLWEGAAVALIVAAVLRAMRRRSAGPRYLTACLGLLALASCPAATFLLLPHAQPPEETVGPWDGPTQFKDLTANASLLLDPVPHDNRDERETVWQARMRRGLAVLDRLTPWLGAAWAMGVLLMSVRLLAGWMAVRRVCRGAVPVVGGQIAGRVAMLAGRLRLSRPVRLLQCASATGPAVIGAFRPIILVPAAAMTGLAPHELEAILAHELAHVRRHDYLINFLQHLVETALFFHPAVWWVSSRVRQERENCCDDIAVSVCGDRVLYATALADLGKLRVVSPSLAPAARGGALLRRINRLFRTMDDPPSGGAWAAASLAAAAVVLATLLVTTARAAARDHESGRAIVSVRQHILAHSMSDGSHTYRIIPLKLPAAIAGKIVGGVGFDPLRDSLAMIATRPLRQASMVGPAAMYRMRHEEPSGWEVAVQSAPFVRTSDGLRVAGAIRLSVHPPGKLYVIQFDAAVRTAQDPLGSGDGEPTDAHVSWSGPRVGKAGPPSAWAFGRPDPPRQSDEQRQLHEQVDSGDFGIELDTMEREAVIKSLPAGPQRDAALKLLDQNRRDRARPAPGH